MNVDKQNRDFSSLTNKSSQLCCGIWCNEFGDRESDTHVAWIWFNKQSECLEQDSQHVFVFQSLSSVQMNESAKLRICFRSTNKL